MLTSMQVDCGFEHPSEIQQVCIPQSMLGIYPPLYFASFIPTPYAFQSNTDRLMGHAWPDFPLG